MFRKEKRKKKIIKKMNMEKRQQKSPDVHVLIGCAMIMCCP
jgi:hypothetical protein